MSHGSHFWQLPYMLSYHCLKQDVLQHNKDPDSYPVLVHVGQLFLLRFLGLFLASRPGYRGSQEGEIIRKPPSKAELRTTAPREQLMPKPQGRRALMLWNQG